MVPSAWLRAIDGGSAERGRESASSLGEQLPPAPCVCALGQALGVGRHGTSMRALTRRTPQRGAEVTRQARRRQDERGRAQTGASASGGGRAAVTVTAACGLRTRQLLTNYDCICTTQQLLCARQRSIVISRSNSWQAALVDSSQTSVCVLQHAGTSAAHQAQAQCAAASRWLASCASDTKVEWKPHGMRAGRSTTATGVGDIVLASMTHSAEAVVVLT